MRSCLTIILTLSILYASPAQTPLDGKGLLLHYLKKMSVCQFPRHKEAFQIQLIISTIASDYEKVKNPAYPSTDLPVSMILTRNKMFYESRYIAIYQDTSDVYTVIHPQKMILHSRPKPSQPQTEPGQPNPIPGLQARFIQACRVVSLQDVDYNGRKVKEIILQAPEETQKEFGIQSVVYYMDIREMKIEKQIISFTPGHQFRTQTIVFQNMNLNYKGKILASSRKAVFERPGKLLKTFTGYELIEQ
jgi:hypothetical protein